MSFVSFLLARDTNLERCYYSRFSTELVFRNITLSYFGTFLVGLSCRMVIFGEISPCLYGSVRPRFEFVIFKINAVVESVLDFVCFL